ncbi:MAG: DUF4251 domain-containing protein [Dysgonomonas sp.]
MKKIIFLTLVGIALLFTGCKSQQDPIAKEKERAIKAVAAQSLYEAAVKALNQQNFVFEADRLSYTNNKPEPVNPGSNFISLSGEVANVEIFPRTLILDSSAIRDINVKGNATNIEMKTDAKGNVTFKMYVKGTDIEATITINMSNGKNNSTAIISPNFDGKTITLYGHLYEFETTKEYEEKTE